jgi:hypothetical protein
MAVGVMRVSLVVRVMGVRVRAATAGLEVGRRRCFLGQEQPLENKIRIEYEQCLINH